jgi:hypothetical protein
LPEDTQRVRFQIKETFMVSQDLLDILRCPVCVHNEPEGGELDHRGNWLLCTDCDRKYPIRDDIPVMLIDEGDRFAHVAPEELPEIPPPEEPHPAPAAPPLAGEPIGDLIPYVVLGVAGLVAGLVFFLLIRKLLQRESED